MASEIRTVLSLRRIHAILIISRHFQRSWNDWLDQMLEIRVFQIAGHELPVGCYINLVFNMWVGPSIKQTKKETIMCTPLVSVILWKFLVRYVFGDVKYISFCELLKIFEKHFPRFLKVKCSLGHLKFPGPSSSKQDHSLNPLELLIWDAQQPYETLREVSVSC